MSMRHFEETYIIDALVPAHVNHLTSLLYVPFYFLMFILCTYSVVEIVFIAIVLA